MDGLMQEQSRIGQEAQSQEQAKQQPPTTGPGDLPNKADVQGLRSLLATWDIEGHKLQSGSEEDRSYHDAATASIHAKYLDQASKEDKEMVGRWTETVNILLTFAALLTAIIAAFLLAAQADASPQASDETNQILLQLLKQFDNTTEIPTQPPNITAATTRVLSWWHASLCCSLSSAFGCLLSKQWIMHYDSQPVWANTTEKKAQLREIRYQSLSTWRFYAIIELLPVILQVSVLLFAIGLAEYLHPVKEHFVIVTSFTAVVGAFFIFTLIMGTVIASCPYKSPITNFIARLAGDVLTRIFSILVIIFLAMISLAVRMSRSRTAEAKALTLKGLSSMSNVLKSYVTMSRLAEEVEAEVGERSLVGPKGKGAAGILSWGMMHADPAEIRIEEQEHKAAAEAIMCLPADTGLEASYRVGTFTLWCTQVLQGLNSTAPTRLQLLEAEVLFHLMYHSTEANKTAQIHIADLLLDEEPLFTEAHLSNYICTSIRKGWSSRHGLAGIQVLGMRNTTIATYLQNQLIGWLVGTPEDRLYHDELSLELPLVFASGCLDDIKYPALADAVSLLSIILVPDSTPNAQPIPMPSEDPLERLLKALHRLSLYPTNSSPNETISLALRSSFDLMIEPEQIRRLDGCSSVTQGQFSSTLIRFMRIAGEWRRNETGDNPKAPGTIMVGALYGFFAALADYSVESRGGEPGVLAVLTSEGLAEIFALYCYSAPPPPLVDQSKNKGKPSDDVHSENATKTVDYVLGLLQHQPTPSRILRFLPRRHAQASRQVDASAIWDSASFSLVLQQIIFNIEHTPKDSDHRRMLLTVCVKARDAISPLRSDEYAGLSSDLDALATSMLQSGRFLAKPDDELLDGFEKWDKLVAALKEATSLGYTPNEKSESLQSPLDKSLDSHEMDIATPDVVSLRDVNNTPLVL